MSDVSVLLLQVLTAASSINVDQDIVNVSVSLYTNVCCG